MCVFKIGILIVFVFIVVMFVFFLFVDEDEFLVMVFGCLCNMLNVLLFFV